jgi:hypothetical protein
MTASGAEFSDFGCLSVKMEVFLLRIQYQESEIFRLVSVTSSGFIILHCHKLSLTSP